MEACVMGMTITVGRDYTLPIATVACTAMSSALLSQTAWHSNEMPVYVSIHIMR